MKQIAKYRVLLAEIQTGVLLESPGVRAINRQREEIAHWFADLEAARAFAKATMAAHPEVECHVQEASGQSIELLRDVDAFERLLDSRVEEPIPSWWQRIRMMFTRGA